MTDFAIEDLLVAIDEHLRTDTLTHDYTICIGEPLNESPDVAHKGWIGIYHQAVSYEPRTLGRGDKSRQGDLNLIIMVQNADFGSGRNCTLELQKRVRNTINAFMNGFYINQMVDAVTKLDVSFDFIPTDSESIYFQDATLDFVLVFTTKL